MPTADQKFSFANAFFRNSDMTGRGQGGRLDASSIWQVGIALPFAIPFALCQSCVSLRTAVQSRVGKTLAVVRAIDAGDPSDHHLWQQVNGTEFNLQRLQQNDQHSVAHNEIHLRVALYLSISLLVQRNKETIDASHFPIRLEAPTLQRLIKPKPYHPAPLSYHKMSKILEKEFTNESWSKNSTDYERFAGAITTQWTNDALLLAHPKIVHIVSQGKPTTFVDVGCGPGTLALAFAEKYFASSPAAAANTNIIATDLADGMLEILEGKLNHSQRYTQFREKIKTIQMDGQALDKLEDNSVDMIGSNFGMSIFPDRIKAWDSAARVLKDDGLLFVTAWDVKSTNMIWVDMFAKLAHEAQVAKDSESETRPLVLPSLRVGTTPDQVATELRAAGFSNVEMYRTQHSVVMETPAQFVKAMLDNPGSSGFVAIAGREVLEDALYKSVLQQAGFPNGIERPTSVDELQKVAFPVTFEFIGHVSVATK
ncbi:Ubiquinone menaquinone biosynthesis methyltransferase, partial [Globisporangium splendens]